MSGLTEEGGVGALRLLAGTEVVISDFTRTSTAEDAIPTLVDCLEEDIRELYSYWAEPSVADLTLCVSFGEEGAE